MKIGCILLAAGAGRRFGGGKLTAQIAGKQVIEYILGSLPQDCFAACTIVAGNEDILSAAERVGISGVLNSQPELGISRSIRMGLSQMEGLDACLFCVCDQPLLSETTLRSMAGQYSPQTILALSCCGRQGNPVIFPASLFGELASLSDEESGKAVIGAHPGMLSLFETEDCTELLDVDTPETFEAVRGIIEREAGA